MTAKLIDEIILMAEDYRYSDAMIGKYVREHISNLPQSLDTEKLDAIINKWNDRMDKHFSSLMRGIWVENDLMQDFTSLKSQQIPIVEEVCTACYGKGTYSVFKGPSIASVDFPGDKSYVIDKGGPKIYPCKRCNGTGKLQQIPAVEEVDYMYVDNPQKIDEGQIYTTPCPYCGKYSVMKEGKFVEGKSQPVEPKIKPQKTRVTIDEDLANLEKINQPVEPVDEIKIDKSAMCGPLDHTYCPKCGVRISRK